MSNKPDVSKAIYTEQVKLLYAALPLSIIATLLNSIILVFVLWSVLDHGHLLAWQVVMVAVILARTILYISSRYYFDEAKAPFWDKFFLLGAIATALLWAGAIIFLFPEAIEYQVFVAFVIAGMSAGAVTSLSYLRTPVFFYLPIMNIPLAAAFLLEGTTITVAMGAMVIIFVIMVMSVSNRLYKNNRQNIAMRFEALYMENALRESENKYKLIFESVPLGIAHYDYDGHIMDYNEVFSRLADKSGQQLQQWNLIKDSEEDKFREAVIESFSKHNTQYEGTAAAIGGKEEISIKAFLAALNIENDEVREGVAIIEDITEARRVERLKGEFISSVSHELRTPLTSIMAVLGLIKGEQVGEVSDEMKRMLEIAERNSQSLLSLINDILDVSQLKVGEINFDMQNISVMTVVKQIVESIQPYAIHEDVVLRIDRVINDECFYIDEGRFAQVLSNLISNALKFSPKGAEVVVNADVRDKSVRIAVSDMGPGIPDEFHSVMFDRFTQYDSSDTRAVSGSGLGLSISFQLTRQMHGELGFETEPGVGSTFYVDFPLSEC